MKKMTVVAVGIALLAGSAVATITIDWKSSWGIDDPTIPGMTWDLPVGSLCQLIWSPDGAINLIDPLNPTMPQGNDVLLTNYYVTTTGFILPALYTFDGAPPEDRLVTNNPSANSYIYTRVFNSGTPGIGTIYDESALIGGPLTDQDPASGQQPDVMDVASSSTWTLGQTVIPEPASYALFGIGLAFIVIRRRFKR